MRFVKTQFSIDNCNSAEAKFGHILIDRQKLLVPFVNIQIANEKGQLKFVDNALLIFEGVKLITWEYEKSREYATGRMECYGGVNHISDEYSEFWVNYEDGVVYTAEDSTFTDDSIFCEKGQHSDFLDTAAIELKEQLQSSA